MIARTLLAGSLAFLSFQACTDDGRRQQPPLEQLPRAAAPAEERLARASIDFGLNLLREVRARSQKPNVVVSPLSVSLAMGLALNGARGETFDALREGLALPEAPLGELNEGYRGLTRLLGELDRDVTLEIANAIFPERTFELLPEYLERTDQVFSAEARPLDFTDPAAVEEINAWASRKTKERIPRILEEISDDEVLFLLNAVYFKGAWTEAFDRERTSSRPFRRADGTTVEVPMMNRKPDPARYLENDVVQAIELPYGRGAFTFVALLPREGQSLDELIERLDGETWTRWMGELQESRPAILLPRLEIDFAESLGDALQALGMGLAFQEGQADFGRLAEIGEDRQLFISRVDHRVFLELDEEGTTAAAVTSVAVGIVSMGPEFYADRPFLLAIRERFTGTLLFLGAIGDPARS